MPATVASSALAVPHSRIRELAEIAMGMDGVLKLYFGESNIPTPEFIKRAAQKAMADGFTYYTENAGLPSLRKSLARYYAELHGVELDPTSEITVTASGVQALSVGLRCMVDPGDEALVLTPSWPNGPSIIQMSHGVVKEIPQPLVGGSLRNRLRRAGARPSRPAPGCCSIPRLRILWAGSRPRRIRKNFSTSPAATACG